MIKRKLCIIVAASLLLTGCQGTELTKSESGQIAEYIAYRLLKYNDNSELLMTQLEESDKSEEPVETSKEPVQDDKATSGAVQTSQPTSSATVKEDGDTVSSVGSLFGSSDFKLSIKLNGLYQSYPKNSSSTYFSLTANSGKKLLVLDVTIKNSGSSKKTFQTTGKNIEFTLADSDARALVTLLEEDIHFMKEEIKSGGKRKAIIVFEVDKNMKTDNLKLSVAKDGQSVDVSVKA